MSDKKSDQQQPATSARSGGVMDVQRPKVTPVTDTSAPDKPAETPTPPPATEEPTPVIENAASADNGIIAPPENQGPPATPGVVDEHAAKDDVHPLLAAHAQKKHSPVVPIITAVVIALALIGVTVFAFLKTKDSSNTEGDHPTPTHQETTTPATSSDIDTASTQVDDTLKAVDDTKDFADAELTDQTLGL